MSESSLVRSSTGTSVIPVASTASWITSIRELAVQFDRRELIKYLVDEKLTDGLVSLTLTSVVNGRKFEGTDTILVIGNVLEDDNTSGGKW